MTVYSKIKHKSEIHSTNNLTASNVSLTFFEGSKTMAKCRYSRAGEKDLKEREERKKGNVYVYINVSN